MVGRHALRGVTLHMLHRAEVLDCCLFHILHSHIILEIKPGTALTSHSPKRSDLVRTVFGARHLRRFGLQPQRVTCRLRRAYAFSQTSRR